LAPARIAIVEDDEVLRESLSETIGSIEGLRLIGAVANLKEALGLVAQQPEVFLVDLSLPDGLGFDLIKELRRSAATCKAIVISVFGDVENVVRAIEVGADGYLLKGSGLDQVADAIATVLAGGAPLSPAVAGHILRKLRADHRSPPQRQAALTSREREVLEGLAKGLTFKELASLHGISAFTVGDHVKAIYRKLEVNSRSEAIFEAAQSGLITF
jgi:DNA-binding NarL/FixJ family response regulator